MAITAVSASRSPATRVTVSPVEKSPAGTSHAARFSHCRTITVPESRCEAVWDEKHRRFFRRQERRP